MPSLGTMDHLRVGAESVPGYFFFFVVGLGPSVPIHR